MHALGFYHEMQRPDRDQFIKVNYANIRKGSLAKFILDSKISYFLVSLFNAGIEFN